jgi:bifunctional non-homologous end joining protein LigD
MPATISPELATLASRAPVSGDWAYEIKFDGYRFLARIDGADVRLFTRNRLDWTDRFPSHARALLQLGVESAWLDGEMVALNEDGVPDFGQLQLALANKDTDDNAYFLFDLLYLNGRDLRQLPLRERRTMLLQLLAEASAPELRFSADFSHDVRDILASAEALKLEGLIGKRTYAPYVSGRSLDWIKLKCQQRQEFVIGGYMAPSNAPEDVRSLLLGVYNADGRLQYSGSAGLTGRGRHRVADAKTILSARAEVSPFANPPKPERDRVFHWLAPSLVAEIGFREWTRGDVIRQPTYQGLRLDKAAREIVREVPTDIDESQAARPRRMTAAATAKAAPVTHAERVIDSSTGFTKGDLAHYYAAVAEWALPHLSDRPVALVRAPSGLAKELFFQKYSEGMSFPAMNLLPTSMFPNHPALLNINSPAALVGAAQMGAIELHTWNASQPDLAHPDRMIFDLDPDVNLPWSRVVEAAGLVKVVLDELGLESRLKTSGGKGLHVVVPLNATQDWSMVKAFSHAVANHLARVLPGVFSAVSGPKNRVNKIFVDYLRNGKGQSTVAAFSARARPGLTVSMPISWAELPDVHGSDQWNIRTALDRTSRLRKDPWSGYWDNRQLITPEMRHRLGAAE